MVIVPGRLRIDADGRLQGPADITWNDPWPTKDGTPGGFGTAYGGVLHTEVGYEHTVIHEFNDPAAQASAFFSIGEGGHIHQYGPLGRDWMAWTQVDGNPNWRGVEHEDKGSPATPLTRAQLAASAQVFEAMSAFDGWPLQATDDPVNGRGIIFHADGGAAWGGHDCPGKVRMAQRPAIIDLARQIRAGAQPPAPPPLPAGEYRTTGKESLIQVAVAHGTHPSAILRLTENADKVFVPHLAAYINNGNLRAAMPKGIILHVPGPAVAIEQKPRPVRKAVAAVRAAVGRTASVTAAAVRAEPAMVAGGTAGALASGTALLQHRAGLHLTVTEVNAALTAIVTLAGVVTTIRTRPVRVGVIATALATLATAAASFGVHLPPAVVGGEMPVAALIAALLVRSHVSPRTRPAVPRSPSVSDAVIRFTADTGGFTAGIDEMVARARQAAADLEHLLPGGVHVAAGTPAPGASGPAGGTPVA